MAAGCSGQVLLICSRVDYFLLTIVFLGCLAFYSGGGWNQNARFAQVRALMEERRFGIDDFLVYQKAPDERSMRRLPIRDAALSPRGASGPRIGLAWRNQAGVLTPIAARPPPSLVALEAVAASGDVTFVGGHFYPNKPPGATFLALPAYGALFTLEKKAGWNPDDWRVLTLNAWLTTAFSIGLVSACGAVVLYRVAQRFASPETAFAVALTAAFGTMAFPHGTMLFDHNLTAALLLGAFAFLIRARNDACRPARDAFLAGLCLGGAVLSNYLAGLGFLLLALYAGRRLWLGLAVGMAGPLAILAVYHTVCFGSPFALVSTFQNPLLLEQFPAEAKQFFGMFAMPNPGMVLILLVSPFRGIFFFSPVLLLAAWGLLRWGRERRHRREALLCVAMVAAFLLVNAAYCGWHGGYGVAPRYLAPVVPFLALGLVGIWPSWPRLCAAAACLSVAMQLALTATDPLSPVGLGTIARVRGRADWRYNALTESALPLLVSGRPRPLLDALLEDTLEELLQTVPPSLRELEGVRSQAQWLREEMRRAAERGESFPFPLAAFPGPVSANPMGIFEGDYFQISKPGSPEARWNSFNLGEFLFPGSCWSLLAVGMVVGAVTVGFLGSRVKRLCLPRRKV